MKIGSRVKIFDMSGINVPARKKFLGTGVITEVWVTQTEHQFKVSFGKRAYIWVPESKLREVLY